MGHDTPLAPAMPPIDFIDLGAQRRRIGPRLEEAVLRVVRHGKYILGPEVAEVERRLAAFCGARHCVTCASGTDALVLALMAKNIGPGDGVFVPAFTFVATAEAVAWLGATPIFVDVEPDGFAMAPASLEAAIADCSRLGLTARAVIPVDLFGQPADYGRLLPLAARHGLFVLADAAQSFGAARDGRRVGTIGDATATSFFPAKPLGCYGDGGAVFTDDAGMAALLGSLRAHGQGGHRYEHVRIGMNGRFDTLQAAILIEKLAVFGDEIVARQRVADRYGAGLAGVVGVPGTAAGSSSVWAQYTILVDGRDRVVAALSAAGVPTAVHYPIPLPGQIGYQRYPSAPGGTPVSESLSKRVLSLPMHPYLEPAVQDRIIDAVRRAVEG